MADTFQLEVATPERLLVDEQVNEAQLPGKNGYMGVLAGHAPLLSALGAGLLSYNGGSGAHTLVIAGGFVEISDNHVRVLAESADLPQDIQQDAARKDLEAASEELKKAQTEEESDKALESMQKAQARIDGASGKGSS
ncbi:MAG TPA: ATP synthase F1 subunit epsilon [Bryobacteraceae bacterium]|jgi:F-type H+-transporting ATPase subunit epsilon|nr:ATP synthase F1 subunit epsilon [Bryobacteraceae bacterium]